MSVDTGLLLLVAPQLPLKSESLKKLYGHAIRQALTHEISLPRQQSLDRYGTGYRLDIALLFDGGSDAPRSQLFSTFQTFVAELYTLVCITAAQAGVDLDFSGGIDVRLFALDTSDKAVDTSTAGPLASTSGLDGSRNKTYKHFYLLAQQPFSSEVQARVPPSYWDSNHCSGQVKWLDSPGLDEPVVFRNTVTSGALATSNNKIHKKVAVGGTFDHLHIGHKLLLTATIFIAQPWSKRREITIGITGDELLVNKKHATVLESWDIRQQRCADFVESILIFHPDIPSIRQTEHRDEPGPNGKVVEVTYSPETGGKITIKYVRISDPFGPTITDEAITALVISAETRAGGKAVNDKRTDKGWEPLEVFEVDVLDSGAGTGTGTGTGTAEQDSAKVKTSFESKISSTEIRRRLAENEGEGEGKTGSHPAKTAV